MIKQALDENIKAVTVQRTFAWGFFFADLDMEFKRESAPPQAFTPRPMTKRVHKWRIWGSIKLGLLLQCNSSLPVCSAFAAADFGFKGKELFWNTVRSYILLQISFKSTRKENYYLLVTKLSLWTYSIDNSHKAPKGLQHKLSAPCPFKNILYILGKIKVLELNPLYSANSELAPTQPFVLNKVTTAEHVCLSKEELHRFTQNSSPNHHPYHLLKDKGLNMSHFYSSHTA